MSNKRKSKEQKEQDSVSIQSDNILEYMQDRFHTLMQEDRMDDAIAIGDEFIEWMKGDEEEIFLYYNEHELKELL
jgi:hypothetical protein